MTNSELEIGTHLKEHIREALLLSNEDRLHFLYEDRWIGYDRAKKIIDYLTDILNQPVRTRPQCLLIVGDPNMGKTTIVKEFAKNHISRQFEDPESNLVVVRKPVISVLAPTKANVKALYIGILDRFFAPFRTTDSEEKLRQQLVHLLRKFNSRMLIIDEMHNLLSGTAKQQQEVMNALKNLSNELNLSIVGVGTRDALLILHTDSQFSSRFDVMDLPKWSMDQQFRKLLLSYERLLPLKRHSKLDSKEIGPLLYDISDGNFGDLNRLLVECTKEAMQTGTEEITVDIVRKFKWLKPTAGLRKQRNISIE